jgi:hypothetical protein
VSSTRPDEPIADIIWDDLFNNSRYQYFFDDEDEIELDAQWLTKNERAQREHQEGDEHLQKHQRENIQPDGPENDSSEMMEHERNALDEWYRILDHPSR